MSTAPNTILMNRSQSILWGTQNISELLCTGNVSARVTPQRTWTTALFDYISAGRSTHCAFYHWRPHLSSDCCIGLEQSAGVQARDNVICGACKLELAVSNSSMVLFLKVKD